MLYSYPAEMLSTHLTMVEVDSLHAMRNYSSIIHHINLSGVVFEWWHGVNGEHTIKDSKVIVNMGLEKAENDSTDPYMKKKYLMCPDFVADEVKNDNIIRFLNFSEKKTARL